MPIEAILALAAFDAPASQLQWQEDDLAVTQYLSEPSARGVRSLPSTSDARGPRCEQDHAELVALRERVEHLERRVEELYAASVRARDALGAASEPTTAARQKALAAAYPEEYVVLLGDRVLVHTRDEEEAFLRYDAAVDEGGVAPIVIPPGALRRTPPPVLRGRMLAGPSGGEPR